MGDRNQAASGHRRRRTLDLNAFGLAQHNGVADQSRRGFTEHHRARWRDGLHPLSQSDLLPDRGVTRWSRTYFTCYDLAGVQPHPHLQRYAGVASLHIRGDALCLSLDVERGEACPQCVILQRNRGAEYRHEAVAGELVDAPTAAQYHRRRTVEQLGHDLAQPLRTDRGSDVHQMHHVGEQHRHLLVFGVPTFRREPRTTPIAESDIGPHVAPAVTAPVPHLDIVTLAAPSTGANVRKLRTLSGVSGADAHARRVGVSALGLARWG
jgi:hypothetical protein